MNADHPQSLAPDGRRFSRRAVRLLAALCLVAAPAASVSAENVPPPHLLQLANGDRLHGTVSDFGEPDLLRFRHPDAIAPMEFRLAAVHKIGLTTAPPLDAPCEPATVTLANGDSLPVEVQSCDAQSLVASSSLVTPLPAIPWAAVAGLEFSATARTPVFLGPFPSQDWLIFDAAEAGADAPPAAAQAARRWLMEDGQISGTGAGSATVDAGLPDLATIEWEMKWSGPLHASIGFFCDSFAPEEADNPGGSKVWQGLRQNGQNTLFRECLSLDLNAHAVMLQIHSEKNGRDVVESTSMPAALRSKSSARFRVSIDRRNGILSFWADDKPLETWNTLGELPATGRAISLWRQHDLGSVHVSRLRVTNWDGRIQDSPPKPDEKKDVLVSTDGSRLSGRLGAFDGKTWVFDGAAGSIRVNRSDIRHILRPVNPSAASPAPQPAAAMVRLPGGFSLQMTHTRLSMDGQLHGRHALLGEISLPFAKTESLEFPPTPATP